MELQHSPIWLLSKLLAAMLYCTNLLVNLYPANLGHVVFLKMSFQNGLKKKSHVFSKVRNESDWGQGLKVGLCYKSWVGCGPASAAHIDSPPSQHLSTSCCRSQAAGRWELCSGCAQLGFWPGPLSSAQRPGSWPGLYGNAGLRSEVKKLLMSTALQCKDLFTNKEKKMRRAMKGRRGRKHSAKARQGQPIKPPNFWPNVDSLFTGDKSGMDSKLCKSIWGERGWQWRYQYWHMLMRAVTANLKMTLRSWTGSIFWSLRNQIKLKCTINNKTILSPFPFRDPSVTTSDQSWIIKCL